jgi:hypothetical protein
MEGTRMLLDWPAGEVRPLSLTTLSEHYRRYRLPDAEAEAAMARSLDRYGQIAPIVVWLREEMPEVIDGFKRLAAARTMPRLTTLSARRLAGDERSAKAAIYGLNREGRPTRELEEAWIVQALVRDDGLTQVEAAHLLCWTAWSRERRSSNCRADLTVFMVVRKSPPPSAHADKKSFSPLRHFA